MKKTTCNTNTEEDLLTRILEDIPLDTEIRVSIEMGVINFLVDSGFREEKMWNENDEKEMKLLCKIIDFSKALTEDIMEAISRHNTST